MPNATGVSLAMLVLIAACSARTTERERVDFERMRIQQRGDLYGASPVFANGALMQPAPPGTRARSTSGDTGVVASGMTGGAAVSVIPQLITAQRLARGAAKFHVYCGVCHGEAGFGGSVVAVNMGPPRPPSLRSARVTALPVGYIFSVATHGLGRMPGYADELTPAERWDVVAYVRRLAQMPPTSRGAIDDSLQAIDIQRMDSQVKSGGMR